MIDQEATHEMRQSEAVRKAAAHGCVVAADRRTSKTTAGAGGWRTRLHTQTEGWCGLVVYVLSEEPKPRRNETVWVPMRNCLRKCKRTQVRPATNEGIETVTSLLPSLTEAVREGRTRHFADITDEGDPEGDEPLVVDGDAMDVRLGRPDTQPEPEFNAPANPDATSRSARSFWACEGAILVGSCNICGDEPVCRFRRLRRVKRCRPSSKWTEQKQR